MAEPDPAVQRTPLQRRIALIALFLWVAASPFFGPGHVWLHGGEHSHGADAHPDAPGPGAEHDDCAACVALPNRTVAIGLCDLPGCPDPDHHHHDSGEPDAEEVCVVCHFAPLQTAASMPPAELAPTLETTSTATAIRLGFDHAGTPGARAPPAIQT